MIAARSTGVSVDGAQLLEAWINKTYKTGKRPLVVALIPTTRDKLFTELWPGGANIAAGDIQHYDGTRQAGIVHGADPA